MKTMKSYEDLNKRWSFMCEGIEDRDIRRATMLVLENSAQYMVDQNYASDDAMAEILDEAAPNPNMSQADFQGVAGINEPRVGVANYVVPKVMLPVIRRVMPQLIAHELVSVQPINGKTGVIFYAEYQYSDAKAGISAGQAFTGNYLQDGEGDASKKYAFYSSQKLVCDNVTLEADATEATLTISDEFYKAGMQLVGAELYPVEGGAALKGTWKEGTKFTLSSKAAAGEYVAYAKYRQESSDAIPEMQFQILSKTVETVERKLKVRFTREAMQDLKAHFNMDLDSELVKMASIEMNYETDREIIQAIDNAVPAELTYSHNWNFNGSDPVYMFLDRHRALAQSIFSLAGKMAAYNRQGAANWAVVSPKIAAILQMLPEFTKESTVMSPNIYTIGSMSKIKYFVDPNRVGADEDTILLGFKNPISTFGAGIVYSPYANWMTPSIFDPNTFDENKGFFSRYAITLCPRGQWHYAKLHITNLP